MILNTINCAMNLQILEEKFTHRLNQIHTDYFRTIVHQTSPLQMSDLPNNYDAYLQICSHLDVRSLINLSQTRKDVSKAVGAFSKYRVSMTNPLFVFDEPWINVLILAVICEYELPDKFELSGDALMKDQLHLLLFKFLHKSPQTPFHRAVISFIYKCGCGLDSSVPNTQKQWRLSLIMHVYHSFPLTETISAFKRHFQFVTPSFTENFVDWLDLLELFATNPGKNVLSRLRNTNHSAHHYLHDDLEEDFSQVINEILQS